MTRMNMDAFFLAEDQAVDSPFRDFRAAGLIFQDSRQDRLQVVLAVDLGLQVAEEAPEVRMDRHQGRRQASHHRCSR
jgi:putative NIF3 family GTP cyclohydrolase 1 type 2